ncbi:MAG: hypothetical protein IPF81_13220 [Bacteroidetes bacterium]|nr:hypothetical protein [Bacteroidota bacterium]
MGGTKRSLFFILLIVFEVGGFLPASARKVLFIGVDGCRWDAIVAANAPGIDGLLAHAIYSGNGLTEYKTWVEQDGAICSQESGIPSTE